MIEPIILSQHQKSYTLRVMVEEDLASVVAIEQVAQAHAWTIGQFRSSVESSHHCYVLEAQQEIVAYAVTSTAADEAELLNITVALNHQRQGLGQLLLTAICTSFDASIHTLFLEVRVSNLGAIALYDALYFNEVGLRPNYYPNTNGAREDAMIMAKPLGL